MIRLVYVASPSFSGSTLLTFLLNAHPDVATIGELKWGEIDLETYQCSCGSRLCECRFWDAVSKAVRARGLPFDLARPPTDFRCRRRPWADRIARARVRGPMFERIRSAALAVVPATRRNWLVIAAVNRAVIEASLDLQGAQVFADASKDPVRLIHLQACGHYEIRVIHLIRDGRGVTNSAIKNQDMSAEFAAREWLRTHRQIELMSGRLGGDRVLRVAYEDLCRALPETMSHVFSFIGVNNADISEDYHLKEHHVLGNRMRLRLTNKVRLDEKWRTTLKPEALCLFERLAGDRNRAYGYE